MPLTALVVDDDADFRDSLALLVGREGFEVAQAGSLADARQRIERGRPDVVLVDLGLPDGDGIELLRDETIASSCELIVVTGNATLESAVQALREGALDYLAKPVDRARLSSVLAGVVRTRGYKAEVRTLRGELRQLGRFEQLDGRSPVMQQVYDLIARVAPTQTCVLLTGESGTGKEHAAATIHALSRRREGPFLAVNCGAVAKTLIESELFGHEKGSFTGAENHRRGYFEQADGGTLFLDEVAEMPLELQVKLLRVLETGGILPVGGSEVRPVDVRVIAATNRDPARAVQEGRMREDLYYRLNVFPVVLPPLRDRGEDIDLLADHFLAAVNARESTKKEWSPDARAKLREYDWPGNVRELKNAVERAAILADGMIGPDLLPSRKAGSPASASAPGPILQVRVGSTLEDAERRLILATLEQLQGDKRRSAQVLGIGLKTLYTRLSVYRAAGLVTTGERPSPPGGTRGSAPRPDSPFVESATPDQPYRRGPPRAAPLSYEPASRVSRVPRGTTLALSLSQAAAVDRRGSSRRAHDPSEPVFFQRASLGLRRAGLTRVSPDPGLDKVAIAVAICLAGAAPAEDAAALGGALSGPAAQGSSRSWSFPSCLGGSRARDAGRTRYSDRRNSSRAFWSAAGRALNRLASSAASPRCRTIASRSVTVAPSCISRVRSRTPHRGAVRTLFAVCWNAATEKWVQVYLYMARP